MTFGREFDKSVSMNRDKKLPISDELAIRKRDHIELAQKARTSLSDIDDRFNYEPLFFSHPKQTDKWPSKFLGFNFDYPIWISSMTGGTEHAGRINENLARLCGEFHLGMGLGSCRSLLNDTNRFDEFAVKKFMPNSALFANIGIAQVEECVASRSTTKIHEMVKNLQADGLIVHLNPLQEWFQPGGDRYKVAPIQTLSRFLEDVSYPIMVKEVGQGMGPRSLKALLDLPISGIELGAYGGTNFTLLEKMRSIPDETREAFIHVGHSALEMVQFLNAYNRLDKEVIISGGISSILDGLILHKKLKNNSVIGMASAFLAPALVSYETLREYFLAQRESLLVGKDLLDIKEDV